MPPLRSTRDRDALRAGWPTARSTRSVRTTRRSTTTPSSCRSREAEPGATGLELLLPLTLKWAAEDAIAADRARSRASRRAPAAILGIPVPALRCGSAGRPLRLRSADAWRFEREALRSQGKNTPFLGLELLGRVRYTLLAGQVVHEASTRRDGETMSLVVDPHLRSLHGEPVPVDRRAFLVTSLGAGFALAVLPVSAQTITTSAEGMTAGEVKVRAGDGDMPAYRAMPAAGGPFPTVLVVQEVFGVHEYIKDVCRRLAKAGYFAIAPELYARQGDLTKISDTNALMTDIVAKSRTRR